MLTRAREEDGLGMIELMAAMTILTVALLALMAGYDSAFLSLHNSAKQTASATVAANQIELYSALSFSAIGLDTSTLATVKLGDSVYVADEGTLSNQAVATDAVISSCGATPQCLPVQTVTGSDHRSYKLETFIRNLAGVAVSGRSERVVNVIVRDPGVTNSPIVAQMSAGFDAGP